MVLEAGSYPLLFYIAASALTVESSNSGSGPHPFDKILENLSMIKPLINMTFIAGVQVLSQPSPRVKEKSRVILTEFFLGLRCSFQLFFFQ